MSTMKKAGKAYYDKEYSLGTTIKRLWALATEHKNYLYTFFFLLLTSSVITIFLPLVVRNGLNGLEAETIDFKSIKQIAWIFFLGTILQWIVFYLQVKVQWIVIAKSISSIRIMLFEKLQDMDVGFYDKMATGRTMNRVMDDSNQVGNLIQIFASFISSLSLIIIILSIMFSINVKLTFFIFLTVPAILVIVIFVSRFLRKYSIRVRRTRAAVNAAVQESVSGVSVTKGFNRAEKNREEFMELNMDNLNAGLKFSYTFSVFFPLIDFLTVFIMFIILHTGGLAVISSTGFGIGDLFLFYMFTLRLFEPIAFLSQQVARIQAGSAATERVFSLLDLESNMITGDLTPQKIDGNIEFRDIHFSYTEEQPIYENLNVKIKAGQTVALVGHTGAGKTTMVSLLARFYEIKSGELLIDGINVQDIDIETYRQHLGIVLQDPYLFSGTLRDNIIYGKPDATNEEIQDAIKLTQLDEFIEALPEGLDTDVRERGSRLSTGQRQLVTFARALVANPAILILDEATASVDAYTESLIQKGLANLFKGRTSIVVAHRLSTIIHADRILVFDHGKIIGDGSHSELIKTNSQYQSLYKTYYEFQGLKVSA